MKKNKCQIEIFPKCKVFRIADQNEKLVKYTFGEPLIWVEKKSKGEFYSCWSCDKQYVKYRWFIKHLLVNEGSGKRDINNKN